MVTIPVGWKLSALVSPLSIGTALHVLIVYKKGTKMGLFGWISLGAISVLSGLSFEYIVNAYYAYNGIIPKQELINAAELIGAALGFGGLMWMIDKSQSLFESATTKYGFGKNKSKGDSKELTEDKPRHKDYGMYEDTYYEPNDKPQKSDKWRGN